MKKIKISIPLSTANLACGFDTFALALSLCNEYVFEESEKDELKGFLDKYNNSNNMCLSAFKETFSILNKDAMNVRITLDQHIPNCGGLGSSANVIIAGVSAAYYFINGQVIRCIWGLMFVLIKMKYSKLLARLKDIQTMYLLKYLVV